MHRARLISLLASLLGAARVAGDEGLPYRVTVVDWDPALLARQERVYRNLQGDSEVLFCIESWKIVPAGEGIDRVVIQSMRRARSGSRTRIADVGAECVGPAGESLPMFHSHSDGNCQQSPADLVTLVARHAPFEGVQCGPRHFVWGFAWQIEAIGIALQESSYIGEQAARAIASRQPPLGW